MSKVKVWLNMAINALSFVSLLSLISSGLILQFTLPSGSGAGAAGMRHGAGRAVRKFAGLTRHEWGDIHFVIALVFAGLLAAHLILHWNWLRGIAWGTKANPQPFWKRMITLAIIFYAALTLGLPFIK